MEENLKFRNEILEILKAKPLAVSKGQNFSAFHFPFKNITESFLANDVGTEKKVILFYPFAEKNVKTNLWKFSGLSKTEESEEAKLKKATPPQIVLPKNKMKSKFQSVFSLKKADVFNFCMQLSQESVLLSRPYSYENTLWAIARDMWEQYRKRDIHTEADRKAVNRIPKKFLAYLKNIDALEIVRTTEGFPFTSSDNGAEKVKFENGRAVIAPNEDGEIIYNDRKEGFYETYKVFAYICKDAALKQSICHTIADVKQREAAKQELEGSGKGL